MAIEEQDKKFVNPDQGPTLESIGPIGETLDETDPIGLHNVHSEISAETKNTNDKELKSSFNKLSVNNILQMEEVKIIKEDGTVINFNNNNNKDDNNNNEDNNNEDNNNKDYDNKDNDNKDNDNEDNDNEDNDNEDNNKEDNNNADNNNQHYDSENNGD